MKIDKDEQKWLIKRYITGSLPENVRKWVEDELKRNAEFERLFTTYRLTMDSLSRQYEENELLKELENYNDEIFTKYLETKNLPSTPEKKSDYRFLQKFDRYFNMVLAIPKQASIWIILLFISAIALTFTLLYPHQKKLAIIPIIDAGRGFGGEEEGLPVVFYNQNPARFWEKETYKWPADTLRIYSKNLFNSFPDHFISIRPEDKENLFSLKIRNSTYYIYRKTEDLTPLKSNEN